MKTKKIILAIFTLISLIIFIWITFIFYSKNNLSEKKAFMIIFGNYDPIHKQSIWKNMRFPSKAMGENWGIWEEKTGIVSKIYYKKYKEDGKNKFFLLTKTVPVNIPYECHACLPLLGATVFSKENIGWKVESQNLFLMYEGEYGEPPEANLIQIGDGKFGVILRIKHICYEAIDEEIALIAPYKKSIENLYQEVIYHDNFNLCPWAAPCSAFFSSLHFEKSKNGQLYKIKINTCSIKNDKKTHDKNIPICKESLYEFHHGKYIRS